MNTTDLENIKKLFLENNDLIQTSSLLISIGATAEEAIVIINLWKDEKETQNS